MRAVGEPEVGDELGVEVKVVEVEKWEVEERSEAVVKVGETEIME